MSLQSETWEAYDAAALRLRDLEQDPRSTRLERMQAAVTKQAKWAAFDEAMRRNGPIGLAG